MWRNSRSSISYQKLRAKFYSQARAACDNSRRGHHCPQDPPACYERLLGVGNTKSTRNMPRQASVCNSNTLTPDEHENSISRNVGALHSTQFIVPKQEGSLKKLAVAAYKNRECTTSETQFVITNLI